MVLPISTVAVSVPASPPKCGPVAPASVAVSVPPQPPCRASSMAAREPAPPPRCSPVASPADRERAAAAAAQAQACRVASMPRADWRRRPGAGLSFRQRDRERAAAAALSCIQHGGEHAGGGDQVRLSLRQRGREQADDDAQVRACPAASVRVSEPTPPPECGLSHRQHGHDRTKDATPEPAVRAASMTQTGRRSYEDRSDDDPLFDPLRIEKFPVFPT
jgi:hypothetical protein